MNKYLLTVKLAGNKKQVVMGEHEALNFITNTLARLAAMNETSAFLQATALLGKAAKGNPQGFENQKNSASLVVQNYEL